MFNIALYQPDIPQNTAAIIRLCSCFNTTLEIIEPCGFHLDDKRAKRVAMDRTNPKSKFNWKTLQSNSRTIINIAPLAIWVPILFGLIVKKVQAE